MLKELIKLANSLDEKGLQSEASMVDHIIRVATDDVHDHDESLSTLLKGFIAKHLDPSSSSDPATEEKVEDMDDRELKEYIIEFLPDAISDTASEAGISPKNLYSHIVDEAQFDERYSRDDDFTFLAQAFAYYLEDYEF